MEAPEGVQRAEPLHWPFGLAAPLHPEEPSGSGAGWVALTAFPVCTSRIQAAAGPRPFSVPRIILTECAPHPPSPPETRLEEPGLGTTPTPRPRTLASGLLGQDNPPAPPGVVAAASQAWNSPMLEKEGAALKTLVTGDCSPERGGAGIPSPWGPALERTQEPSTAETSPEETHKDSGHHTPPCSGEHKAQRAAITQRMDSLEETLRELEATLSQMGMASATGPPGSPPPLPPGPQVAACHFILSTCLPAPVSLSSELEGVGVCRSTMPAPLCLLASLSPATLLGAWCQAGFAGKAPGRLGSWPAQGSA
ncbi:uncharacterized protein [Odocoileus virginianus]|uniref:Uncharacterized protein n=1 Tax=Odocoileus virginianus TaxID=9874 RepID=A0ABM4J5Y5_ODOVR